MIHRFFHLPLRRLLGLALALTACTPAQETTPRTITPTETSAPAPAVPAPWSIFANQSWQDAYAFVHPGDVLEIDAEGTWSHNPADPQFSNPYGPGGVKVFDPMAILPSAPLGSLVGRIGDNPPFEIGEHLILTSEYRGQLWVSMNDNPDQFSDNKGLVGLVVRLGPKPVGAGTRFTSIQDGYTLVYPDGYFVVLIPNGFCLTQNANPTTQACDVPIVEVGDTDGKTAQQLADQSINVNDLNFRFESYEILVDGERAIWISREGSGERLITVIIVHGDHVYTLRFLSEEFHPSLGQEEQVMNEMNQVQNFYDTVINSFQFLD